MQVAAAVLGVLGVAAARSGETTLLSNPAKWFREWATGGETTAGPAVNADTVLTISAWWACVKVIAEDLAKLPLELIETADDGTKRVIKADPRLGFLNRKANDLPQLAFSVRETLIRDMLTWGNGFAGIERDQAGRRIGWYNIEPWRVTPKIVGSPRFPKLEYDVRSADGSSTSRMTSEDMFHIRGPSKDGVVGMSVIRAARESMALTIAAERYGAKFFHKGARPGGVIEHPKSLSAPARLSIRDSFESMAAGGDNVARIAVLDEGMKFTPGSIPPEDAQFLQTRQFQVEEVCRWFRMPPHKISHLLRSTNNNIEHQGIEYVTDTLGGPMKRFESEADAKLLDGSETNRNFEHDDSELTRGDRKSRFESYKLGIECGMFTPDDALRMESMNPHPNGIGSKPLAPLNFQLLEDVGKAKAPVAQDRPAQDPSPQDPEQDDAPTEQPRAIDAAKLVDSFLPIISMATRAIANLEADRCERGTKNQSATDWAAGFYRDHELHARGVLFPAAEALHDLLKLCGVAKVPSAAEIAKRSSSVVIKRAMSEIGSGTRPVADVLIGWRSERPAKDAELVIAEIKRLLQE